MKIYWLIPGGADDYPRLHARHPRNREVDWVALGRYLRGEGSVSVSGRSLFVKASRPFDALHIAMSGWVVSDRARAVFDEVVPGHVSFVPVAVNGHSFWGMRVTRVLSDALDPELSDIAYLSDGSVDRIVEPVWRAAEIPDPSLFHVPQQRHSLWATDSVAKAYQASGCDGISFGARGEVVDS
jgi:hypothetical protein